MKHNKDNCQIKGCGICNKTVQRLIIQRLVSQIPKNKMADGKKFEETEYWVEDYKKIIIHNGVEISAHGIFVIRDFIRNLLTTHSIKGERNRLITMAKEEGIMEERQAWLNGFRCFRCGREVKTGVYTDTCDKCWNES